MNLSPAFGAALAEARRRAGHATPYAFFKARGAKKALGLAFVNYLRLEAGRSLPKPERLTKLLSALGLRAGTPDAAALVRAYARAHLGSDELYACLDQAPAPTRARSAAEEASEWTRRSVAAHLTLDQYKIIAGDADAYALNAIAVNTGPWISLEALSREAGLPAERTRRGVAKLTKGGLAVFKDGEVRSAFWNKHLLGAPRTAAFAAIQAKFDAHRRSWVERRGRGVHRSYTLVRARDADMRRYYAHLDEAVYMSALYGDIERGEGSGMYLIEANAVKL